jgi:hypothetical protein
MVKSYIGAEFMPYMRSMIKDVGDERVLVIECLRSTQPTFFARDKDESFFVRMTNTTQALKASESVAYIGQHFSVAPQPVVTASASQLEPDPQSADSNEPNVADSTLAAWVSELMDRHVIRTAVIYFVVAWALTESGTMVAETLSAPAWVSKALVIAFIAGFPLAVMLSWIYDIRTTDETAPALFGNRRRTNWLVGILALLSTATITLYTLHG